MQVTVKLLGWMRQFLADSLEHFDEKVFDLAPGTTAAKLVADLGFAETEFMLMRNGDRIPPGQFATTALVDGDTLLFVPPLKGG